MRFETTQKQDNQIKNWLHKTVYPIVVAKQKESGHYDNEEFYFICYDGVQYPYEGAIGGGLTWKFTGTSIGDIIVAVYNCAGLEFELNVTDYDSW
jgi:hypothetical protein